MILGLYNAIIDNPPILLPVQLLCRPPILALLVQPSFGGPKSEKDGEGLGSPPRPACNQKPRLA
jgi:hypothetical protein